MSDSELLAFVRSGGTFKGGKGWRRKGGKKGDRKGGKGKDPPPRGRSDLRCINCGGKGHTYRDCRQKELPREQRLCLNRGKPGHISRDCKEPRAAVLDGGADAPGGRYFNLDGDQEARMCSADEPPKHTKFPGCALQARAAAH